MHHHGPERNLRYNSRRPNLRDIRPWHNRMRLADRRRGCTYMQPKNWAHHLRQAYPIRCIACPSAGTWMNHSSGNLDIRIYSTLMTKQIMLWIGAWPTCKYAQCAEHKKAIDQPCRTTSAIIFDFYATQLFVVLRYSIAGAIGTVNIVTMDRCNAHHRPHEHTNFDVVHGLRFRFIFVNLNRFLSRRCGQLALQS